MKLILRKFCVRTSNNYKGKSAAENKAAILPIIATATVQYQDYANQRRCVNGDRGGFKHSESQASYKFPFFLHFLVRRANETKEGEH